MVLTADPQYDIADSNADLVFFLSDQIGRFAVKFTTAKTGLLHLLELLDCKLDSNAIQKAIVGRVLALVEEHKVSSDQGKDKDGRIDLTSVFRTALNGEIVYPDVIVVPKKSGKGGRLTGGLYNVRNHQGWVVSDG